MESTSDAVPAKRKRTGGRDKTQIPAETMLQVLLWLDRFDLDGKQITTRRFRSLVENNQMPLRKVSWVEYNAEGRGYPDRYKRDTLCIRLLWPAKFELEIETDADAQKAATYLSSCFVSIFGIYGPLKTLPKNALIAAPALIRELDFRNCSFDEGEEDTLSETLKGSRFQHLLLVDSPIPVWQIDDNRLESLRLRGCNVLFVSPNITDDAEKFALTEEGIVSYCFALDDEVPMPESRFLRITRGATITPALFKKAVEGSKNSKLTCDVTLWLEHIRFDVSNLDLGVLSSRTVHFTSENGEEWNVIVRHGKKDRDEFFEPPSDEEEDDEAASDHESE